MSKGIVRAAAGALVLGLLVTATAAPVAAQETDEIFTNFTVTSATVDAQTGAVTVTGTVTCARVGTFFLDINLAQTVGRFHTIRGYGGTVVECTEVGQTVVFTATVEAEEGKFAPGRARLRAYAIGNCTEFDCEFQFLADTTLRLTRR